MSNQITMVDVLVKNIIPSFRKKYANVNHFEFTDDGVTNVRIAFYHKGDEYF